MGVMTVKVIDPGNENDGKVYRNVTKLEYKAVNDTSKAHKMTFKNKEWLWLPIDVGVEIAE